MDVKIDFHDKKKMAQKAYDKYPNDRYINFLRQMFVDKEERFTKAGAIWMFNFYKKVNSIVFSLSLIFFSKVICTNPDNTYTHVLDNDNFITYYLALPNASHFPITIIFQGSQSESAFSIFSKFKEKVLQNKSALLVIEKPGIESTNINKQKYIAQNNVRKRVSDAGTIIERLRTVAGFNGFLIIMGGSEGSTVASLVASDYQDQVQALVLLATGSLAIPFEEQVPYNIATNLTTEFRFLPFKPIYWLTKKYCAYKFNQIRKKPLSATDTALGEYSHYWWTSILEATNSVMERIKQSTFPVLIAYGEKDDPSGSNKQLALKLRTEGYNHIDFNCYPGLNHTFEDSSRKNYKEKVVDDCLQWIQKRTGND